MIEIGAERDKHTLGVINRRSNTKTNDKCHNIFERPVCLRKRAQEFAARLLRWPDPTGSLADHPGNKIVRRVKISEKKNFPSCEMETYYSRDMRCHLDGRFSNQGYDNIRRLLSRVAQGKLVLGVIEALGVESVRDSSTE